MWTLDLTRRGRAEQIKARHLVFAVGAGSQIPKMPKYANKVGNIRVLSFPMMY